MKRTLSVILAVFMIATCFFALPLSAEEADAQDEICYFNDYAKLYYDLALKGKQDATALKTEDLGLNLFAKGTKADSKSYANLTSEGLEISSTTTQPRGFTLNADLKEQKNYLVQMRMRFDAATTTCYPFFGFGVKESTTWDVRKDTASWQNIRFNGGSKLVINGFSSTDDTAKLWTLLYSKHEEATYQFVVENGILTRILILCDGTVYTYKATGNISSANGDFSISLRSDGGANTRILLKSIAVLPSDRLVSAGEKTGSISVGGVQDTLAKEQNTYDVRFFANVDTLAVWNYGFKLTVSFNDANGTARTASKTYYGSTVYESVLAAGETVKASNGSYFAPLNITGIPKDVTATFTVMPFLTHSDGTVVYGETVTYTVPINA